MDKNIIIKEIITYLRVNKTNEMSTIPLENIFGEKYDYLELIQFIKDNVPYVEYGGKKYVIGVWDNIPGLFYFILNQL